MTQMFRTAGWLRSGYDIDQVDEFFTHARKAYEGEVPEPMTGRDVRQGAFDMVRGGYESGAVDGALDRLERAFVVRQRAEFVATHGQPAWLEHLASQARTLYGRLARPEGERFAPPPRGEQGYAVSDVDALCRRLVEYFDNGQPLTSDEVRHAQFRRARGHGAYAEPAVDAFCDRAIEVLLGVE
ncbi:MAG TPA: DivIVA domain-containing protein [Actinotalea sp.]|nr:DivIVA domain-containing protein [Actinotalea sp.]